jgi:hypothetical protein
VIVRISDGRLGNQLFQFAFLATQAGKNEKIIAWGFEYLLSLFDIKDSRFIFINEEKILSYILKYFPSPFSQKLRKLLTPRVRWEIRYGFLRRIFEILAKLKVISYVSLKTQKFCNNTYTEIPEVVLSRGTISSVKYVGQYFFQSEKLFGKDVLKNLEFKEKYVKEAEKFISKYQNYYKVAVHIRLGDFKNFYICGENPILPFDYFHRQIRWFLENRENPFFIFLSDEPGKIKNEFSYLGDKMVISENPWYIDFLIITMCDAAIIGPSSFSWWACYFMKKRDIVFAPKYWLGFKIKKEFPQGIFPSFATPCEVD